MKAITTDDAPPSIGPFSQAIVDGDRVYVSGQGPIEADSGDIVTGSVREQTAKTMENIDAILEAAGTDLSNVVKASVFLTDMDNYDSVNEAYAKYVSEPYPARSAIEVRDLPVDIAVEIEVIATLNP